MKVVQINTTCNVGSTGKICVAISKLLTEKKVENYILYTHGNSDYPLGIKFATDRYKKVQALKSRVLGNVGFNSRMATRKLIRELDRIGADIVHIHNIHSHDCDLTMLFHYLKEKRIKLYWTFHDFWACTGSCTYSVMVGCERWKTECGNCPQIRQTSWFFDRSRTMFRRKKELFSGLDLTIITPSQWLAEMVKQSFMKDYPVKVIHNGINLAIFKPTPSDFRERYNIPQHKDILLGVSFGWDRRKGLDVFKELAKRLDSEKYQIVLVGTDNRVDQCLPDNIISIHRTQNQAELAEIYSAADLFVNPTREETLGLVNIEANACGIPVVTFRTGGSPECINENSGCVVDCDDIDALEREIKRICAENPFSKAECVERAKEFDMNDRFEEYVKLYG